MTRSTLAGSSASLYFTSTSAMLEYIAALAIPHIIMCKLSKQDQTILENGWQSNIKIYRLYNCWFESVGAIKKLKIEEHLFKS